MMDEPEQPKLLPRLLGYLPLALALLALVAAGVGIFLALQYKKANGQLRAEMQALQAKSGMLAEIQNQVRDLDGRLVKVGSEVLRVDRKFGDVPNRDNIERILNRQAQEISQTRTSLALMNEQLAKFSEAIETLQKRPAPAAAASSVSTSGTSDPVARPGEGIHVIQSGETLGLLAQRYKVSLEAILQANPGINPNRLQIGQQIVIP